MSVGFLAEMLTALHGRAADAYSVAERLGADTHALANGEETRERQS
jgi:hypothetical protein